MIPRTRIWLFVVLMAVVLASPPLRGWLNGSMPRLLLIEMPAWVLLGWLAGRPVRRERNGWNPLGLTGLAFFVGALGFWMIPRSVDAVRASEVADQLMHASLLLGGATLSASAAAIPFVVRAALGVYGASMTFALGMIYSNYRALLCGAFDLAQQRSTGHWLLVACPFVLLLVLGAGVRALVREGRATSTERPITEVFRAARSRRLR